MGKRYYECPAEAVDDPVAGGIVYRPLLAAEVDAAGGSWSPVWQDSDVEPTAFVVAVNDRADPGQPRRPEVHERVAGRVASATFLGHTFAQAKSAVRARRGKSVADRLQDQQAGGE